MRNASILLFASMAVVTACTAPRGQGELITAQQKATLAADSATKANAAAQEAATRRMYDMFNTGNLDSLANYMGADVLDHQMDPSIKSTGLQAVRNLVAMYRTAMPDFHQEILAISTTGDRTWLQLRLTGTNTGPLGATPATGKAVDVMGIDMLRFEHGKAVEHWGYMEEMKMMQQLGLMPTADTAAKK